MRKNTLALFLIAAMFALAQPSCPQPEIQNSAWSNMVSFGELVEWVVEHVYQLKWTGHR